jgi:hypothetical protein
MDAGLILGMGLAALFAVSVAFRAYRGDHKEHIQRLGKKDLEDRIIPENHGTREKQILQTDPLELYHNKACVLLNLLANVKKKEGIRDVSLTEINNLANQMEEIKKGLEGTETKYNLREADVRMSYASSRIGWLIKSYPRLRNDSDTSALISEIRRINHRLDNLEEG